MSALATKSTMRRAVRPAKPARMANLKTKALLDPAVAISGATATMLATGRFVFLPYQREESKKQEALGPKAAGSSYYDNLQKNASFYTNSNDPAGFNIIDVFAWGALGHALGFAVLAISSFSG